MHSQPKIRDSWSQLRIKQDVCRLQVPMDEAFLMGKRQRLGNRHQQPHRLLGWQPGFLRFQVLRQILPRDILLDDEQRVALTDDIVDRDDPGMRQPCGGAGFLHKPAVHRKSTS